MAANLSQAAFLYRAGQEQNFSIPVRPETRLGFDRSNDVEIPFEGVSRHHAKLSFDGQGYWIEDTGSSNGTFLNGRRVLGKQRLEHLDVLRLGRRTRLIFVRKRISSARVTRRGILAAGLEVIDGLEAGTRYKIPRGSITIGRSPKASVIVDSHLVSKQHVRLERSGRQLLLIDLQSSNGTFVNGESVDSRVLADGDEISLGGGRTYRVHIEEGEMETGDTQMPPPVAPQASKLPTDWKTRIEWSPEEKEAFDDVRKGTGASGSTSPRPAVDAAPESVAAPKAPPAVPAERVELAASEKLPAEPIEPARSPLATKEVSSPKPAATVTAAPPDASLRDREVPALRPPPPSPGPAAAPPVARSEPAKGPSSPSPKLPPSPVPLAPVTQAPSALRVHLEGSAQSFEVGLGDQEVGRLPQCAIRLQGPQISRRHAVLHVLAGEIVIEDLGSANGTFLNGKQITGRHPLSNGDLVQFGDMGFRVRIASERP